MICYEIGCEMNISKPFRIKFQVTVMVLMHIFKKEGQDSGPTNITARKYLDPGGVSDLLFNSEIL
jgi:hypothetical protein